MITVKADNKYIHDIIDDFVTTVKDPVTKQSSWVAPADWEKLIYSDNTILLCSKYKNFALTKCLMDIIKDGVRFDGNNILLNDNIIANVLKSVRGEYSIERVEFLMPFDIKSHLNILADVNEPVYDVEPPVLIDIFED